jgi:hypothetical protein
VPALALRQLQLARHHTAWDMAGTSFLQIKSPTGNRHIHPGGRYMHRAVLYEFHEADPSTDRFTHTTATGELTIVLVDNPSKIPALATELAGAGVELIELCGGVPLAIRAKVKTVIPNETRVASVTFGIESLIKAGEFNQAFMAGNPPAEACILLVPDADPANDRIVRNSGPQTTSFILSDARSAADVGRELAEQGGAEQHAGKNLTDNAGLPQAHEDVAQQVGRGYQ